jgi:hypothetical protein
VFEDVQRDLVDRSRRAVARTTGGPWAQLEAASLDFLEATATEPGIAQIFLIDGFTALGFDGLRRLEAPHNMADMRVGIERAMDAGEIPRGSVDHLLNFLWGGLCEIAIAVARSEEPPQAQAPAAREVKRILTALAAP